MKLTYAVVVEQTPQNFSAYAPELPGCVCTADTWIGVQETMGEAIAIYIEESAERNESLPAPQMSAQDALAFHSRALSEYADEIETAYTEAPATVSTTAVMIDIEVPAKAAAAKSS